MVFPSPLGLGTWQFSGAVAGLPTPKESEAIFRRAYELGVRHLDTAQSYNNGVSETVVGGLLKGCDDVFVASKMHLKPSAAEALAAVDESRRRLGRDVIDLMYLHWPRKNQDLRPLYQGFEEARARGWIRFVGASNFSVADLESAATVSRIDAHQFGYSLLWRYPERDVIPWCRSHGVAVVSYGALAHGLLTGRARGKERFAANDPRNKNPFYDENVFPAVEAALREMTRQAGGAGAALVHLALAWVLGRPGVAASLVGASSIAQADETLSFDYSGLPGRHAPVLAELTRISDELWPVIPDIGNVFRNYP